MYMPQVMRECYRAGIYPQQLTCKDHRLQTTKRLLSKGQTHWDGCGSTCAGLCRALNSSLRQDREPVRFQSQFRSHQHPTKHGCIHGASIPPSQPGSRGKGSTAATEGQDSPTAPDEQPSGAQRALKFLERQFLPLGLLTSLAIG